MTDGYYHYVEIQEPRDPDAVIHDGRHQNCAPCYAVKLRTVSFGASCTPTRRPEAVGKVRQEKDLDQNLAAYKRLRESGVQPASTGQAANLERYADTQQEIESGRRFGNAKRAKQVESMLKDIEPPPLPAGLGAA